MSSGCGLSVGFLSPVEWRCSSVFVASLETVCAALEVPLSQFFIVPGSVRPSILKAGQPPYQMRVGSSAVVYSLLSGPAPHRTMEAFIAEDPPKHSLPISSHEGEDSATTARGSSFSSSMRRSTFPRK